MTPDFVFVAAIAGILSFLTPCVFPMVPITLAYFGNRSGDRGSRSAAWFAAGILISFTLLGVAVAAIFGAAIVNRFAADPRVNLALAALFLLFAANLFGFYELTLPSALLTRAAKSGTRSNRASAAGSALLGGLFSVTSLTCTAPFVGSLLVLAAGGARTMPLIGMLVYSAAFALPFYVLARAPRLLGRLPRSGPWLQSIRVSVGVIEVAAAVKFIANADVVSDWGVVTRSTVLIIWAALCVVLAAYLAVRAILRTPSATLHGLAAVAFASLAIRIALSVHGAPVAALEPFLPPARQPAGAVLRSAEPWILNDLPAALAKARATRKLVFIDFSGYTCTNCRWMESHLFSRADVRSELRNFVLARLYTDGEGAPFEAQQALQERQFGTVALPLYAIVDSDGKTRATFAGLSRDSREFIAFMRSASSRQLAAR